MTTPTDPAMSDTRENVDRRLLRAAIIALGPLIRADERRRVAEQIERSYDHAYDWTPGPRPDGDEWASGYRQRDRQVRVALGLKDREVNR